MRFQFKVPLLKPFSKASIFLRVFGRFSVDGGWGKMHQKVRMHFQRKPVSVVGAFPFSCGFEAGQFEAGYFSD